MNNISKLLREGDPFAGEPSLSAADIREMRRAVMAADVARQPASWWPQPILVAATIALTLTASVALGRWLPPPRQTVHGDGRAATQVPEVALPEPARRQLQVATPGGTRIIWVFNSDFTL